MSSSGAGASGKVGIGDLVDLAELIDRDRDVSDAELRRRDREVGRRHEHLRNDPPAQLLAWLASIAGDRRSLPGAVVDRSLRTGMTILFFIGLLLGWLAAAAVFYYDGSRPVNIINVLAVFVGAQVLLVALLALSLLPGGLLRSLPVVRTLLETIDLLRPGRLLKFFTAKIPPGQRDRMQGILDSGRRRGTLYGRVGKWSVTLASQVFAAAFNVGALTGALHLVFFTDLAFAWSTTLTVTAAGIHRATALLSTPWASWLPAAVPSPSLVQSSRFFRLSEGLLPVGDAAVSDPALLGGWWPFLLMAMFVYGLLPRLLLLVLASSRLSAAARDSFLHYPGVSNIFGRMNGPLVDTRAREAEVSHRPDGGPAASGPPLLPPGSRRVCINWGEVPFPEEGLLAALPTGTCSDGMLRAGGGSSVEEDRETVRRASSARADGAAIFARSWEPPMEDLLDFIAELREALGPEALLTILLAGPPAQGGMAAVGREVTAIWESRLGALADPRLSVEAMGGEPS